MFSDLNSQTSRLGAISVWNLQKTITFFFFSFSIKFWNQDQLRCITYSDAGENVAKQSYKIKIWQKHFQWKRLCIQSASACISDFLGTRYLVFSPASLYKIKRSWSWFQNLTEKKNVMVFCKFQVLIAPKREVWEFKSENKFC